VTSRSATTAGACRGIGRRCTHSRHVARRRTERPTQRRAGEIQRWTVENGHPKDRRTDLKQNQVGIAATGDGGIPVHAQVFDGGAAEVSQVVGAMKDLRKLAGEQEFLMVADAKLVSYANIAALLEAEIPFTSAAWISTRSGGIRAGIGISRSLCSPTPSSPRWPPPRGTKRGPQKRFRHSRAAHRGGNPATPGC
jgi:hypothetical protein